MPIQPHAIPALLHRPVTTVALSPFGRILRTILPTVCARHPARFTGGLYIPTCTNSPWPVPAYRSDRLRGRLHAHLSANIFRCRFYTCSRQAHYSAGLSRPDVTPAPARCNINLCQRFVTPDVLPTYADEQTRPSIPSGRHGFLSAPTAASRTAVPNLTPSPHTVSIMPCPRGFRSPLWVAVKTFAASSGLFYLFGTTFNSFCRG